jgi:hypothetical protein
MTPYVGQISGSITGSINGNSVTSNFTSVTDVIGGKSPIPGMSVRDALMKLNPGQFMVEVPGGADVGANAAATIHIPSQLQCPEGTTEE